MGGQPREQRLQPDDPVTKGRRPAEQGRIRRLQAIHRGLHSIQQRVR